jgi:hypothetical protein
MPGLSDENVPGDYEACGEAVCAVYFELIEMVESGAA